MAHSHSHTAPPAVRAHLLARLLAPVLLSGLFCAAVATSAAAAPVSTVAETNVGTPVSLSSLTASAVGPGQAVTGPLSAEFLVAQGDNRIKGDDGRRTFGVQPSGPTKPDPRPNLTYRNVRPGQRLLDHVAILNISNRPVTLTVFAADAFNTPEGGFDARKATEKPKDLGSWVKLRRNRVTVPARSAFITPIELRIPKGAEPGDHAAAIMASLRTVVRDPKGNLINRDDRVGTRLYVRVTGKLRPEVKLDRKEAVFRGDNLLRGKAQVTYTIKNTGNVRLVAKQAIRVSGLFGWSTNAGGLPDLPELLPGNELTFTRPVEDVVPTFLNSARITIDPVSITGNVDPALAQVTASSGFTAISWPALIVLLLLLGIGGRFLWRRRRRSPAGPAGWGGGGQPPAPGPGLDGGDLAWVGGPQSLDAGGRAGTTRRVRLVVAGLIGAAVAIVPVAAPASAASGTLTFIPGKATATTPIYAVTSGPCPRPSTHLIGMMFGSGMPAKGAVVLDNQNASIRFDGAFGVPLRDNLKNIAEEVGATLQGPYRISIRCIDQFNLTTFSEFTGTVTFDRPTEFTAPVPAKPPVAGVPPGYLAAVFPEFKKALPNEGQEPASTKPPAQVSQQAPAGATNAAGNAPASGPTLPAPGGQRPGGVPAALLGIPVMLAMVAAAVALWLRRPVRARVESAPSVPWPDELDSRVTTRNGHQ